MRACVFPDYTDAVEKAPFDIDKNHMKIPTNEERIKVIKSESKIIFGNHFFAF